MSEIGPSPGLNTHRIEAFSDGVFAVAITLLVLNLQVPQLAASAVSRELVAKLIELWPKLLIYVLSFVIVGIYWVAHHNSFHYIERSDRTLLWLNLLLLLCIVFIPFPIIYLLAIGVSFLSVQISLIFFILVPLYYIFPGRIDRHWMQRNTDRVDEATPPSYGDVGSSREKEPPSSISLKSENLKERRTRNDSGRS